MQYQNATLANGLNIVAETNPHALSTAIGFFVRTGARDETPELAGVSHFLEHMAFKGSEKRSADDVNREFDRIGAKYNAYTTEEHTVFYSAVLPEYSERAIDLLADLLRPSLRSEDFYTEQKVIIEEIGMYADSPMWTGYEKAMRLHFSDHQLGNSVLGTEESVGALTPDAMRGYHESRYSPSNIFVAAAGNIDFGKLVAWIDERCGHWKEASTSREVKATFKSGKPEVMQRDQFVQECLFLLSPGPDACSPQRIPAELLATVLGDDTGSRFYWELAEPGKVDSVDFGYHEYEGMGLFIATAGCAPEQADEDLAIMKRILADATKTGVTEAELSQAKNKVSSRIVLASERPQNRLSSLGYNWSYRKTYRSIEDDLADIAAVTTTDIAKVLRDFPLTKLTTVCLGPLAKLSGI